MRALRADDTGFDTMDIDVFVLNQHRFTRILSHNSMRTDARQCAENHKICRHLSRHHLLFFFGRSEDSVSFLGPDFGEAFVL